MIGTDSFTVCVVLLIVITITILYLYYLQETQHQYQLAKINALEYKYRLKEKELDYLRSKTQKCHVPDLNNPRSCYFGSNYTCSWNELIGRCDLI